MIGVNWDLIRDIAVAVLLIVGALMSFAAGIGLLRFPDLLSRMHAATKPQVLGLLCLLAAVALATGQWVWVPVLALIWVFQLLTAPVSAHMVGRAAYRSKHLKEAMLVSDDLAEVVRGAQELEEAKHALAAKERAEREATEGLAAESLSKGTGQDLR